MIFVPMRQDDGGDVVPVLFQKIEIGNRNVNAVNALFGKAHACVYDDHLVVIAHGHTVHPKLADAAERDEFQYIAHCVLYSTLLKNPALAYSIDNLSREKFSRIV